MFVNNPEAIRWNSRVDGAVAACMRTGRTLRNNKNFRIEEFSDFESKQNNNHKNMINERLCCEQV